MTTSSKRKRDVQAYGERRRYGAGQGESARVDLVMFERRGKQSRRKESTSVEYIADEKRARFP